MVGIAQPFESHHFGGDQLGPVTGQPVKSRITIALGAGAAGISDNPHIKFFFQQVQCCLQQAHMGLTTSDDDGVATFLGLGLCGWALQMFGQAAGVATARRRSGCLALGRSQPFAQPIGSGAEIRLGKRLAT